MRILGQGFRIHLDPPFSPGFGEQNEPLLECIVPKLKRRLHVSNYVVVGDFYLIVHMSLISYCLRYRGAIRVGPKIYIPMSIIASKRVP